MVESRNIEEIRSLSYLYVPSTIRNLLNHSVSSTIQRRIRKHKQAIISNNKSIRFSDFLGRLYSAMVHSYRNEYIYKNTIINKLLLKKHRIHNSTLLRELKVGNSIADLVFINGGVCVYEIKTDLDNLSRLDGQLEDYKKIAEKIFIVTDSKYVNILTNRYKDHSCGIIELTNSENLKIHKEAGRNSSNFDCETIFKLLRKAEYLELIEKYFGSIPDLPNTKIFKTCLNMSKNIDVIEFQEMAFKVLRKRKIRHPEYLMNHKTPFELKYACYSLDLTTRQYSILYEMLSKNI
jgi:hypothetical protein